MTYLQINMEKEYFVSLQYDDIRPNHYEISNYGSIRIRSSGNIMKPFLTGPYYRAGLTLYNGKRKNFSIHRLVAITFCDNIYDKKLVNHIDGDKHNNYYANLEWVTNSENVKHAYDTGLAHKGDKHHLAKYSDDTIHLICKLLEDGTDMYNIISIILNDNDIKRSDPRYKKLRSFVKKLRQRNFRKDIVKLYSY